MKRSFALSGKRISLIFLILSFSFSTIPISMIKASPGPTKLYVDPPRVVDTTLTVNETFSVNVSIAEVADLYHWKVVLYFPFNSLLYTNETMVEEGPFLQSGGTTTFSFSLISGDRGIILECEITSGTGVDGDGTLVTITFQVKDKGDCELWLRPGATLTNIWDSTATPITHEKEDGYFRNVANLYLEPETIMGNPGDTFSVDVNIVDVEDVYGWQFELSWEPGKLLTVTSATEGGFLKDINPGSTFFSKTISFNNVFVACTLTGTPPTITPVSGGGLLATINFDVDTTGNTTLHLSAVKVIVYNYTATEPPWTYLMADPTTQDGYFYTTKPVAEFDYEPSIPPPCAHQPITFNATASFDPDDSYDPTPGGIVNYSWDFGDENTTGTTDPIIIHTYDEVSIFAVNLTVTDDDGEIYFLAKGDVGTVVRDIAVINVTLAPEVPTHGDIVNINMTVKNLGDVSESFNVTAYYDDTEIGTNSTYGTDIPQLSSEKNVTLSLKWNTTTVPAGDYTIKANATIVTLYENNTSNNLFVDGTVDFPTIHDIAVTDITFSPTTATPGDEVDVDVTVSNLGSVTESFQVSAYYDSTLIGTKSVSSLGVGASKIVDFDWDTIGVDAPTYALKANVTILPDEANATNNLLVDGNITFTIVHDLAVTAVTFSPTIAMPGTIVDVDVTVRNLGTTTESSFDVSIDYDSTTIDTKTVSVLPAGQSQIVDFDWDTTGVAHGDYTVKATVTLLDDIVTINNELEGDTITFVGYNVYEYDVIVGDETFLSEINSTSAISNFGYNGTEKEIDFHIHADGLLGSDSYFNITFPEDLLDGPYTVYMNDTEITPTIHSHSPTSIYYAFTHAAQTYWILIFGTTSAVAPVANFTASTNKTCTGEMITFNATASSDPDGVIESYRWDFDDGNVTGPGDHPVITHSYTDAGNYNVTLTVTDDEGFTDNATTSLDISLAHNVKVKSITPSSTTVVSGETVSIDVIITNEEEEDETDLEVTTYYYDGTKGQWVEIDSQDEIELLAGAELPLAFEWNTTGVSGGIFPTNATISGLPVETNKTDNTLLGDSIKVLARPVAVVAFTPTGPVVNQTVTFEGDQSHDPDNGTITSYEWNFGDGNTTSGNYPTILHKYEDAGTYAVILTVTDNDTLTGNTTSSITVGKLTSSISISASSTNMPTGSSTTVSGSISPIRTGTTVTVKYRPTGGSWSTLATVTTDANGQYSYSWRATTAGTYEVRASWEGDVNTLSAESSAITISVGSGTSPAPDDSAFYYVVLAVAITALAAVVAITIIGIAVVYLLLKMEKQSKT